VTSDAVIPHISLTQRTADALMAEIMAGTYGDEWLPSVRELSEHYGVSSLVVREALARLQARGALERRQGRRTRIVKPDHSAITAVLLFSAHRGEHSYDELRDCRAGLETKGAQLAARATRDDKEERLLPHLEGMRVAASEAEFNDHDLALHMAISELSGNRPIAIVLAALRDVMREMLDESYRRVHGRQGPRGIARALEIHEAIVAAILEGDDAGASSAMAEHFDFLQEQPEAAPVSPRKRAQAAR
jgi:DNA-binding FadR family transcriptional regulator